MEDYNNVDEMKNEEVEIEETDRIDDVDNAETDVIVQDGADVDVAITDKESESTDYSDGEEETPTPVEDERDGYVEEEVVNSKKKIKSNKSMSKKKKSIIAITVSLCIVAIVLSIVLPVVFYCKPRIFVKNADQFIAGDKVGELGDYFYMLDKNIVCDSMTLEGEDVYSIDMNKHSLTVDGDFVVNSSKSGTLFIGTRKSDDEYTSKKASLKAKNIRITAPNTDIVIMADISCESVSVTAKSLRVGSFMNGEFTKMDMSIMAENVRFSGNISGSATSIIDIYNAKEVLIDSGVSITNTMQLTASNLIASASSNLATVMLDDLSRASVAGTINNAIMGGAQVNMQNGHSCNTYQDINTLVIYRDTKKSHLIKNCKNVIYVEKLVRPVDINIEENGNRIFCNAAGVKHAVGYKLMINGEEVSTQRGEQNTRFDITDYVKNIGTYSISVVPLGDFTEGADLTDAGHKTMYVDGDAATVEYKCEITLQSPQNLRVDENFNLQFDQVLHADYYLIFVDGAMVIRDDITALSEDLSIYIGSVGDHSIRVQAFSFNDNIYNSPIAMISYSTTEALEAVDPEQLSAIFKNDGTAINVTWQGIANGYEYIVYLQANGDPNTRIEVGRTSVIDETGAIVYTINIEELPDDVRDIYNPESDSYFDVYVVAAEHDYFTQSAESVCRVRMPAVISTTK